MVNHPLNIVFFVLGWVSLGLGIVGIFLPILPTTPLVLLAAYCFSKASRRWHQWLLRQPYLGRIVTDWEKYGAIRRRAKVLATVFIIPLFAYTLIFVKVNAVVKVVVAATGVFALSFIWTRPSGPRSA